MNKYQRQLKKIIQTHGRAIVCVTHSRVPYAYTIGNHPNPELLLIGQGPEKGGQLLNLISDELKKVPDMLTIKLGRFPLRLITPPDWVKRHVTVEVAPVLGIDDYRVKQVLVPDQRGIFPGSPLCDPRYAIQHIPEGSIIRPTEINGSPYVK